MTPAGACKHAPYDYDLMLDQAHDLRRLATHDQRSASPPRAGRPAVLAVSGAKGGVGTTTVALNLAVAAAQTGRRTMLVDADPRGGDTAILCGIEERFTLADVLAGRKTWNEALCGGPSGVEVTIGQRDWHECAASPAAAAGQLFDLFDSPDLQADLVVVDAGNMVGGVASHVCRQADAVVIVTTSDMASVVCTFAAIKKIGGADIPVCQPSLIFTGRQSRQECLPHLDEGHGMARPLHLLVNMATTAQVAEIAHYRLTRACRRLLGVEPQSTGHLGIVGKSAANHRCQLHWLNLQAPLADTVRRVLAAEPLLSWRGYAEFDADCLVHRRNNRNGFLTAGIPAEHHGGTHGNSRYCSRRR
jgi:MinD-like ATPase involved in chromosome partitioning or flagellar assembly